MGRTRAGQADYDSPWKDGLRAYFPQFLELLFPDVSGLVDWRVRPRFLDTELRKLSSEAEGGAHRVDLLVRVATRQEGPLHLVVHVELQAQRDADFPMRMFIYHYRAFDCFRCPTVSLGVLADGEPGWRPTRYTSSVAGCSVTLQFPVAKLLDLRPRLDDLECSSNPIAVLVAAHLRAQESVGDVARRTVYKHRLVRGLLDRRLPRRKTGRLLRLVDWLLRLPRDEEDRFWKDIEVYEGGKAMAYIPSYERFARERGYEQGHQKGREEGREEGLEEGREEGREEALRASIRTVLETRLGPAPADLGERLEETTDLAALEAGLRRAVLAGSYDEFLAGSAG